MLTLSGDILNWLAAGIIFPLMFLPLAGLIAKGRMAASLVWLAATAGVVGAGVVFAWATPVLSLTPPVGALLIFAACLVGLFAGLVAIGGPDKAIALLDKPFSAVARAASRTVMWLLLAMAFVQFGVVILRYVFGVNFIFMQESITYMHGAVFLLAAGYALIADGHVRVDIFYREAPARRKALIDFLGTYLFLFPICILLLWTASPYVANSWAVREGSTETSGIQAVFLLKSLVPAFAVLLAMAGFAVAAKASRTLRGMAPDDGAADAGPTMGGV